MLEKTTSLRFEGSVWCNLDIALRNMDQVFRRVVRSLRKTLMNICTRRHFTKTLAAAGAAAAFGTARVWGANDRVRLGFIGLGNRGGQVLDAFLAQRDVEVAALCDIYAPYVDYAAGKAGGQPGKFTDYGRLLELKHLDAVVIATPDHWHALQTIHACQAGKDVYAEKPLSLCVAEGRRMVEVVRRTGRVCQVGIHRRSVPICQEAVELVRSGALGKITVARAFHIQNEWPKGIGHPPNTPPPPGVGLAIRASRCATTAM